MEVCNCSIFCCTLLYVHSSIAIILMGKRELIALLNLSSWCLVMVERLFLAVPRGCLQFVIVVFPDRTPLLFKSSSKILLLPVTRQTSLMDHLCYFCAFMSAHCCLVVTCLERSRLWCNIVRLFLSHLISCVRCGT